MLSTANLLPLAIFKKFKVFIGKPIFSCKKNPISESFDRSHCSVRIWHQNGQLFQSQWTSNWLSLAVFKNSSFFSKKPSISRTQYVEKTYWFIRFCGNFVTFIHLPKKFKLFSREPDLFFKKQILNVLRNLTVSVAFYSKIDTYSHFKKNQIQSENLFIFSQKQKYFEYFEKTAIFNCILQQNCHL